MKLRKYLWLINNRNTTFQIYIVEAVYIKESIAFNA